MKIKSPIGFLALWSAFLGAGTWILPMGLPVFSVGEAAHAAAPAGHASENHFVGSEVDLAWRSATGQTVDMQSNIIAIVEGSSELPHGLAVLDLTSELISTDTTATWIPIAGFEVFSEYAVHGDPSEGLVHGVVSVHMIAGTVIGSNGSSGHFVGAAIGGDATLSEGSSHVSGNAGVFLPITAFATVDLALAHLSALEEAASSTEDEDNEWPGCGDGSVGISCWNPNWVGDNGEQCCRDQMCRDQRIALCDKNYRNNLIPCILASLGGGAVGWVGCLATKCKWALYIPAPVGPALFKKCALVCLGVGVAGAALGIYTCFATLGAIRDQCYSDANLWYYERLNDTGCSPKPNASPTAVLEILNEQKLEKGEGLQQAFDE